MDFYTTLTGFGDCLKEQSQIKSACLSEELEREVAALVSGDACLLMKTIAECLERHHGQLEEVKVLEVRQRSNLWPQETITIRLEC